MADILRPAVGRRLLDVGGGAGTLLGFFLQCERILAVDVAPDCVEHMRETFRRHEQVRVLQGDIADPAIQRVCIDAGVDSILCTNVLEHVEHDGAMLEALQRVLEPSGGRLGLLVPAHPWLYGAMDAAAGHYRRYTRNEVRRKLEQAGFRVELLRSMNSAAVVGWWWNGRCRRRVALDDASMNAQIRLYDGAFIPILRALESLVVPPFGLSLVAIASTEHRWFR
jgi:2-polyprenyl-3-methyl-5-hydroxy-6-metoxy-1,4-benzoquinol methylase